ncbi:MAG: 1-(5-phosphoribosyl)-5-[(5-phosphoribosylamino)methylideneamino]imidazole-4-carboxamide isomerase [Candidatus Omnitrophota bacterium]|nr:1-(5-phosphoribosyl)-5-[(5-phosphoribosylamino)methylideneamino]imidazole-4-carboxamide isomerase [Candidatus Omnitrophota bacterium]
MLIIPAIDLKDGQVVRLYKGKLDEKKVYSTDPVSVAKQWQEQGAELMHLVDLDGAFSGISKNIAVVEKIIKETGARIEFGGGVRSVELIQRLLDAGVWRVVLGTRVFEDEFFLTEAKNKYQDKLIVSTDIKNDGTVAIKGWAAESAGKVNLSDFAQKLSQLKIKKIIYTDIERDGTLAGVRTDLLEKYLEVLSKFKISLIMAGGVASLEDLKALAKLETKGLEGIIIGKALYEGKFSLGEALKIGGIKR